jgi:hypothetical protein
LGSRYALVQMMLYPPAATSLSLLPTKASRHLAAHYIVHVFPHLPRCVRCRTNPTLDVLVKRCTTLATLAGLIVEASSLASIQLPPPTFPLRDSLPAAVVDEGKLSALQLEGVLYACQRHQVFFDLSTLQHKKHCARKYGTINGPKPHSPGGREPPPFRIKRKAATCKTFWGSI